MNNESIDIDEAFDLLHDLTNASSDDRPSFYSSKNSKLLEALAKDIGKSGINIAISNEREFVRLAEHLEEREAYWSKNMGETFLSASELRDSGDIVGAIKIIEDFVSNCSSESYKEIANTQKENYGSSN